MDDKVSKSQQTVSLFLQFFTGKNGIFPVKTLVNELPEVIDGK